MRILVVAATDTEIAPLAARLGDGSESGPRVKTYARARHDIDVLTTGVGMVATAAWCSRALAQDRYAMSPPPPINQMSLPGCSRRRLKNGPIAPLTNSTPGGASAGGAWREKTMCRLFESNFAPMRRLAS
jgi:hypothetical protein